MATGLVQKSCDGRRPPRDGIRRRATTRPRVVRISSRSSSPMSLTAKVGAFPCSLRQGDPGRVSADAPRRTRGAPRTWSRRRSMPATWIEGPRLVIGIAGPAEKCALPSIANDPQVSSRPPPNAKRLPRPSATSSRRLMRRTRPRRKRSKGDRPRSRRRIRGKGGFWCRMPIRRSETYCFSNK